MTTCAWHRCAAAALAAQTIVPNPSGKGSRPEWLCADHAELVAATLVACGKADDLIDKWAKLIAERS